MRHPWRPSPERALLGKVMEELRYVADLIVAVESGALPEEAMWQDIYERCQELLGIDTAREALAEWELMWEVAYHSREVCDVRHPLWGRRAPEQEQANRLGLQQALDALRTFE